jgi:fructose-bisphosphate aldolase class II
MLRFEPRVDTQVAARRAGPREWTCTTAELDLDLIARLADRLPVSLVLHGSSGVPGATLRAAVAGGIRKVNVGTALDVGYTAEVRQYLAADEPVTDQRKYLAPPATRCATWVTGLATQILRR